MTPEKIMRELAAGLRDALREVPLSALEKDPEEAFVDLAAQLILRLTGTLTVVPVDRNEAQERVRRARANGAERILDILTVWMRERPERHFVTAMDQSGKFEIIMRASGQTQALFQGESVQDAYAQAALTVSLNGGALDGEA